MSFLIPFYPLFAFLEILCLLSCFSGFVLQKGFLFIITSFLFKHPVFKCIWPTLYNHNLLRISILILAIYLKYRGYCFQALIKETTARWFSILHKKSNFFRKKFQNYIFFLTYSKITIITFTHTKQQHNNYEWYEKKIWKKEQLLQANKNYVRPKVSQHKSS